MDSLCSTSLFQFCWLIIMVHKKFSCVQVSALGRSEAICRKRTECIWRRSQWLDSNCVKHIRGFLTNCNGYHSCSQDLFQNRIMVSTKMVFKLWRLPKVPLLFLPTLALWFPIRSTTYWCARYTDGWFAEARLMMPTHVSAKHVDSQVHPSVAFLYKSKGCGSSRTILSLASIWESVVV